MKETVAKIKNSRFIKIVKDILNSKYFPFVNAAISLLCYYLGLDIVLMYYIVIVGSLIFVLSDDLTPIISLFLFISLVVSAKNTPQIFGYGPGPNDCPDYYFKPVIYIQIIVLVTLFIGAAIYRLALTIAKKKFTLTPAFWGMCAFCFALMLNGLFTDEYDINNLLFGFILSFLFLGIFAILKDNIIINKETFEKISFSFLALSVVLIIELAVAYITTENIIVDGNIDREKLTFGWGIWNTMGMMLLLCIPPVVYLAAIKKLGYLYTLYSILLFAAVIFSCSKQAILGGILLFPVCLIILLVKGKNRIVNLCITGAGLLVGIILLIVFRNTILPYFIELFKQIVVDGELSGSGRTQLWREAVKYFKEYPILGNGFFVHFSYVGDSGLGFIPLMCHNTILQLLSSCGIFGLVMYLVHRVQSVMSFFKNVTIERSYLALTILSILILSLIDNHIFNVFPTLIYSSLIAVFFKSETKEKTLLEPQK